MKRFQILAHRGWHLNSAEKNTRISIERALDAGFGIETDLRDCNQRIVISHDPPIDNPDLLSMDWLLGYAAKTSAPGKIALNIKSDGLAPMINAYLEKHKYRRDNVYAFDMSVPDALHYIRSDISTYSRLSEYEKTPSYRDIMSGVWIDSFLGVFPQIMHANDLIQQGVNVTVVSPELHGRCQDALWCELKQARLHRSPLLQICTDLPDKADAFFSDT